jgi:polyhydroxybutyrate depolymerase
MTSRTVHWIGCLFLFVGPAACGSSSSKSGAQPGAVTDAAVLVDAGADADAAVNLNASGTGPCGASTIQAGTFDLAFQNVTYNYIVHLPPNYDGTKRTPLVLNWHGYTSNASQEETFTGMDAISDSEGFILVYPNSPDMSWNAGTCCAFTASTRDDVGFAMALIAQLREQTCIDAKRIYTTGMSNGAFMSYRLGCEHAETFAAIAPVAGKVGIPSCMPSRPVPLMAFHGDADPLVSYDAGTLSGETPPLSVPDTVKAWATRSGCTKGPDTTYQMGVVTCSTWSACTAGATVTLCTVQGAGHCWPGQSYCPSMYGTSTTDINASTEIGAFFKKFSLP